MEIFQYLKMSSPQLVIIIQQNISLIPFTLKPNIFVFTI